MFISEAFAQTGGAGGSTTNLLFQLALIVFIFYVLIIRPQQKQVKVHREMVKGLKKGDKVVTAGGIFGEVVNAEDPLTLVIKIADNVNISVARFTVKEVLNPQPEPKKVEKKKPANSNKKKA